MTRALLGVAVGVVMTASVTLVADYYLGPKRAEVMGRQAAFASIGGIMFLVCGGLLADLSWRAPFGIYLLALPVLAAAWKFLPEPARNVSRQPGGQAASSVPWMRLLLLALLAFCSMVVFYLVPVQIPFHLVSLGALSATFAGMAVAATTLFAAISSALFGRIRSRLSRSGTFTLTFALIGLGFVVVAMSGGVVTMFLGLAVFGLGLGLLIPGLNTLAGDMADTRTRGIIVGVLTTGLFLGGFSSPLAAQPVIERFGSSVSFAAGAVILLGFSTGFGLDPLSPPVEHRCLRPIPMR